MNYVYQGMVSVFVQIGLSYIYYLCDIFRKGTINVTTYMGSYMVRVPGYTQGYFYWFVYDALTNLPGSGCYQLTSVYTH